MGDMFPVQLIWEQEYLIGKDKFIWNSFLKSPDRFIEYVITEGQSLPITRKLG